MRAPLSALLLWGTLAGTLQAQRSHAYLYFAPGGVTCCGHTDVTFQLGIGSEGIIGKGIGLGAELGAVGPRQDFAGSAVGVLSPNGYYHFVHGKESKFDPFVTAGYTLLFREGHANLFNFGGGMNYWFHNRFAGRVEMRDQVYTNGGGMHYWGVRFGLAFR